MEDANKVCPTDILVDLRDIIPPYKIAEGSIAFDSNESRISIKKNGNTCYIERRNYQSILDDSPIRLNEESDNFNRKTKSNAGEVQHLKSRETEDCPTAILIDVPSISSVGLELQLEVPSTEDDDCKQQDELKSKSLNLANSCCSNSSETDFADYSPKLKGEHDQLPNQRLRWKTPSPQSMSRINKEACKVIHTLNSSAIFDDDDGDSLLTEEIFPISLNFDGLDHEINASSESSNENEVLSSSVSVQTENIEISLEKNDERLVNCARFPALESITSEKCSDRLIEPLSENTLSRGNAKGISRKVNSDSKESSSEISSDSLDSSSFSAINDGTDDVFIAKSVSSENKENMQGREIHKVLYEDAKTNSKTISKKIFNSKPKLQFRGSLKNLSNVKYENTGYANGLSSADDNVILSQKSMSLTAKANEIQPSGKVKMKKTSTAMVSQIMHKRTPPNSFHLQSTKGLVSSVQKPRLTMNNTSFSSNSVQKPRLTMNNTSFSYSSMSSLSFGLKNQPSVTNMKTPLKRYSISTPLKSASAVKSALTPSLQSSSIARYTPQPIKPSRLSFSKSCQQPPRVPCFSISKELKQPNSTNESVFSNNAKLNSSRQISFNNRGRQSFSQSMSAVSFQSFGKSTFSTSTKSRLCSKLNLPSPLPLEDKKLARALFSSSGEKNTEKF